MTEGGAKLLKRLICLLCSGLLAIVPIFAVAEQTFSMAGFDGDDSNHDWSTNRFFTSMEARTGIRFTFDEYTGYQKWQEAKENIKRIILTGIGALPG